MREKERIRERICKDGHFVFFSSKYIVNLYCILCMYFIPVRQKNFSCKSLEILKETIMTYISSIYLFLLQSTIKETPFTADVQCATLTNMNYPKQIGIQTG